MLAADPDQQESLVGGDAREVWRVCIILFYRLVLHVAKVELVKCDKIMNLLDVLLPQLEPVLVAVVASFSARASSL